MVRVSELVAIKRENVHLNDRFMKLEAIETKTRRARLVPISARTIPILFEEDGAVTISKETFNYFEKMEEHIEFIKNLESVQSGVR